ncbi:hypothetical protein [Peribacillus simplex]|uniref:hypothetical protein n=1 Tax=Peribacillus simplex TaxID=1478 RepID=UPI000ADDBA05|nr:hypothetical protein [Peribacillus simplex]
MTKIMQKPSLPLPESPSQPIIAKNGPFAIMPYKGILKRHRIFSHPHDDMRLLGSFL